MKKTLQLVALFICITLGFSAQAAVKYWDIDGTTPGAGGATPAGTWNNTATMWNDTSDGSGAVSAWDPATVFTNEAVFSAGSDASGTFTVTVGATYQAGFTNLIFEEGTVEVKGTTVGATAYSTLFPVHVAGNTANIIVNSGAAATLNIGIPGTAGNVAKLGPGTLTIANTTEANFRFGDAANSSLNIEEGVYSTPSLAYVNIGGTSDFSKQGRAKILSIGAAGTSGTFQYTGASTTWGTHAVYHTSLVIGGAGGGAVDVSTGGTVLQLNRGFSGTGSFTKAGPGTLQFNVAATYSGDTTISAGTLKLNIGSALPVGDVTITGILDMGTFGATVNALSGSGTVIGASTLTAGGSTSTSTFSGDIGNGGVVTHLTKTGSGSLTLSGSSATTGDVTVSGGALILSGAGAVSSAGSISMAGGTTLDVSGVSSSPYVVNSGQTLEAVADIVTLNGSLTLASGAALSLGFNTNNPATADVPAGTVTLNNNATTINVSGGALASGSSYTLISQSGGSMAGSVGSSVVIVSGDGVTGGGSPSLAISGGELVLNISAAAASLSWGPANGTWSNGGTGWESAGTTVFTDGDTVNFNDTYATGTPVVTLDTVVQPAFVVANNSTVTEYTITGTGTIAGFSGASTITKSGTGTLTIAVASTIPAGVVLNAGQLNVNSTTALGAGTSPLVIAGGALGNTSGGPITIANDNPQNWNADFSFEGTSDLNLGTGGVTLSGPRTVTANANALTVGGAISGATYGLTKAGSGTLILDGAVGTTTGTLTVNAGELILGAANTFSGDTRIVGGTLTLDDSSALQNSTLDMANGDAGTLVFSSGVTDASIANLKGGRSITLENASSSGVALTLGSDNASQTYNGSVSGSGSLTKTGTGTLSLENTGQTWTHTGGTTVGQGGLRVNLSLNMSSSSLTNNGTVLSEGRTVTLDGIWGNGIFTSSGSFDQAIWNVGVNNASSTFTGQIIKAPVKNNKLNKSGTGTLTLSGVNTIGSAGTSEGVTINGGKIVAHTENRALGSYLTTVNAGTVEFQYTGPWDTTMGLNLNNGSTLVVSGGNTWVYARGGGTTIGAGAQVAMTAAASTDTIDFGGNTTGGIIAGGDASALITVAGPGKLSLNSQTASTYAGKWLLTGGTLQITNQFNSLGGAANKVITLQGGVLQGLLSAAGAYATATTVSGNTTINPNQTGAGADHSYGTLSINGSTLNVGPGALVSSGTEIATFTTTTLTGSPTFNVTNNIANMKVVLGAVGETGSQGLTKTGAGTLEITGVSTYSGNTSVSGGTLALTGSGSIASSAIITVGTGATLDASGRTDGTLALGASQTLNGSGTVAGTLAISGTVAPGTSIGELATGNETWNNAGEYDWEVSNVTGTPGTDWDHLNITGDLTVAATSGNQFVINVLPTIDGGTITGLDKDTSTTWTIATVSGTVNSLAADKFVVNDLALTNDLAGGWFFVGEGSVTLTYTNNHAPTASPATYTRYSGSSLKIPIANLLGTYSADPDGQERSLTFLYSGANANESANGYTITTNASYILYTNISDATADTIDFVVVDQANYRAWDTKRLATNTITINTVDSIGSVTVTNSGGGNLTIGFHGIPNYGYVVQRSDTVDFSGIVDEILTTNAPSNGMFEYTETPPYNPAFYRIRSQ